MNHLEIIEKLPIFKYKNAIIKDILGHTCTILLSETGSGKSTLVPYFLSNHPTMDKNKIVITQPRRIAVKNLYDFVSNLPEGSDNIGYQMRFYQQYDEEKTRLLFATDGILLVEATRDPFLSKYNVIIIDEAHERRLNTDLLIGIIKRAISNRNKIQNNSLRVIIMSATIDPKIFYDFFEPVCPTKVLYLSVKSHPLEIRFLTEPVSNYIASACETVIQHHRTVKDSMGIIVFMPGEEEIIRTCKLLRQKVDFLRLEDSNFGDLDILTLHGSMQLTDQTSVINFKPKAGHRKVIVSTNIAETSLTIPTINCVIDSGYEKVISMDTFTHLESLTIRKISQSQAWQRAGRANRNGSGVCYFLYPQNDFLPRPLTVKPELYNSDLSTVILNLSAQNIKNIGEFPWISKPCLSSVQGATRILEEIKAVTLKDECIHLTLKGKLMNELPINPRYAFLIIHSVSYECYSSILSLASLLSVMPIFFNTELINKELISNSQQDDQDKIISLKAKSLIYGDISRLLAIYKEFLLVHSTRKENKKRLKRWCQVNNLNQNRLEEAKKIRLQLHKRMKKVIRKQKKLLKDSKHQTDTDLVDTDGKSGTINLLKCFATCPTFKDQIVTLKKSSTNGLKNVTNGKSAVYISERHQDIPFVIHPESVLYEYDQAPQKILFLQSTYETTSQDTNARVLMRVCSPITL